MTRTGRLSDAEWKVMGPLWDRGPSTAREVLDALGDDADWAYTTVKTLLDRLVDKGVLGAAPRGRSLVYRTYLTRTRAQRSALRSLVDRAFEGSAGPLVQMLLGDGRLGRRERERLRALLDGGDEER